MNKYLILSLIPSSAMAEDFIGQKGIGLVIILVFCAAVWIVGAKILRVIFSKNSAKVKDNSKLRK